jgi:peptidoglycan/LPS O-acetylase OafA/YrhL
VVFIPEQLSIITTVKVLLTYGRLNGGEHLWYIPYCLFCYLITPFLSRYFKKNKHVVRRFLLLSILAIVITETFFQYFNPAWIFCYILGFFLGRISDYKTIELFRNMSLFIVVGAVLLNFIQIAQDYVLRLALNGIIASLYGRFCNYAHVFLGVALFIAFKATFSRVFKNGYPNSIKKLCLCSDKYSYDVYLVHQFVILGPFSLMKFTHNIVLNIVLIMTIIVVGAIVVNFISTQIKYRIEDEGNV